MIKEEGGPMLAERTIGYVVRRILAELKKPAGKECEEFSRLQRSRGSKEYKESCRRGIRQGRTPSKVTESAKRW